MLKTILIAAGTLIVGLIAGFFLGRMVLENQWSKPVMVISQADEAKSKEGDADPTPPAGTRILRPLPLRKAREAAKAFTAGDKLVVNLVSFGNGEDGGELHVVLENRTDCKVIAFAGVAYGFDAYGKPQKANKRGEPYIRFVAEKQELSPKDTMVHAQVVKHTETASLGVAHVDTYTCEDGRKWERPKG